MPVARATINSMNKDSRNWMAAIGYGPSPRRRCKFADHAFTNKEDIAVSPGVIGGILLFELSGGRKGGGKRTCGLGGRPGSDDSPADLLCQRY